MSKDPDWIAGGKEPSGQSCWPVLFFADPTSNLNKAAELRGGWQQLQTSKRIELDTDRYRYGCNLFSKLCLAGNRETPVAMHFAHSSGLMEPSVTV